LQFENDSGSLNILLGKLSVTCWSSLRLNEALLFEKAKLRR
jgi:hypothetical protein